MDSVEKFLECVERSQLIQKDRLAHALSVAKDGEQGVLHDGNAVAAKLVDANLLTRWQADMLLRGKSSGFFLGQYKILEPLGVGHQSSVYRAAHTRMPTVRAIKVLAPSRVADAVWVERFQRQAWSAVRLNHANIPAVHDIFTHGKYFVVVLELIEGANLAQILEGKTGLEPWFAANVVRQVADALAHAHKNGVVHRDVKPSHVMVDRGGKISLLGWSMSRDLSEKPRSFQGQQNESLWSTPDYLAPEQLIDCELIDMRTDIYSLGCTLYFALTGRPPSDMPEGLWAEIPDLPPALYEACRRMTSKSLESRQPSIVEVVNALNSL